MPTNVFLPSEDETTIKINFPDGQESIEIDAIDIEVIVRDIQSRGVPEDTTLGHLLALAFAKEFNRKFSRNAAIQLWNAAYNILVAVKKKLHGEVPTSDSSD